MAVGGTLTVGGVAAVAVAPSTAGNVLTSNGTAWTSQAPAGGGLPTPSVIGQIPFSTNGSTYTATQKITQGTAVASTSGTSIDFTGIPSWVKRVTVMFNGVSTNGTANPLIQIGSGSVQTTGYSSVSANLQAAGATISATTGFIIYQNYAPSAVMGSIVLTLIGSNIWAASGVTGTVVGVVVGYTTAGNVTLSGALDRVRITTVGGTDTFDAGSINIMYE